MNIRKPLLREYKIDILENVKQTKQYVQSGKLSEEDLKTLIEIDPTPTRKFVGWMAKIWITEHPDLDDLRNTIEEYNTFLEKGKTKTKDIYQFKTFRELQSEVNDIKQSGKGVSIRDLEQNYDTIVDNQDLLIMSPYTHAASRKLGLSHFAFRDCEEGGKDSAWCTTYKAPDHFNDYYYRDNLTFYYIKVRSEKLFRELKKAFPENWQRMVVTAITVDTVGNLQGFDGLDKKIKQDDIKTFTNIIGIS